MPWSQPTFFMYFIFAIAGFGGFGIWVEAVGLHLSENLKSYDGLYTALATFYPALIAACGESQDSGSTRPA